MRLIKVLAEGLEVALLQRVGGFEHARALLHDVFSPVVNLARKHGLAHFFKLLGGNIRKAGNARQHFFQRGKRFFGFGAAFVVLALLKRARLVAVGDDERVIAELERNVIVLERLAVEQYRVILFAERGSELVHNAAVHAVVGILASLPEHREPDEVDSLAAGFRRERGERHCGGNLD